MSEIENLNDDALTKESSTKNVRNKKDKMTFEKAMSRLEEITEILSSKQVNLDVMIDLYEEGENLRSYCDDKLNEIKARFEVVSKKKNNESNN